MATAPFETPQLKPYPVIPLVAVGAMAHSKPFVASPIIQARLGFPDELVEGWEQRAVAKMGRHILDTLLEPGAAAKGVRINGQEELRGAGVKTGRVGLDDLVTQQGAAECAREELHHQGEAGALVAAHRQEVVRGENRRRVGRRVPVRVESPSDRNGPVLTVRRRHAAQGGLAHGEVQDDRVTPAAAGRCDREGIVAQQRPRRSGREHVRNRVGGADADAALFGGEACVRMRAPPVGRPGDKAGADSESAGPLDGGAHALYAHVAAGSPVPVEHARGSRIADHADARVRIRPPAPEPGDEAGQHQAAV